jgi:thiamine-monophosphate kinase
VHAVAQALGRDPFPWFTSGGEDYELLLTCAPSAFERLAAGLTAATGTRLSAVGEMTAAADGIRYLDAGGRAVSVRAGFEHFVTGRAGA